MNFRFMARNIAVDWRQVSLIDIDRIARDMDIPALQQHIELVTFAKLDSLYDIDPLFVKLFQIAQYTLEYLLHSQDFLKNSVCEEQKKVEKEKKKHLATMKEVAHLKEQIGSLKKTNKQRRQMIADQQRMMQVGSHSFYKCPVCPNRSFMNSTYLQGHLVRRHPEHVHYIGDAVAHTKLVTQQLEGKLLTMGDRMEQEKELNAKLQDENRRLQEQQKRELIDNQDQIREEERRRYEQKLKTLEESFSGHIAQFKANEGMYQTKISELESKNKFNERRSDTIGSMVVDLQNAKEQMTANYNQKFRSLEDTMSRQVEQAVQVISPPKPSPVRSEQRQPVRESAAVPDGPVRTDNTMVDRDAEFRQLLEHYRPQVETMFRGEMERLGVKRGDTLLTETTFKRKLEEIHDLRSRKQTSRPDFYNLRSQIEDDLKSRADRAESKSDVSMVQNPLQSFDQRHNKSNTSAASFQASIASAQSSKSPPRPPKNTRAPLPPQTASLLSFSQKSQASKSQAQSPIKAMPRSPKSKPAPQPPTQVQSFQRPQWSDENPSSPGKPGMASTMRQTAPVPDTNESPVKSSVESSAWDKTESEQPHQKPHQAKGMRPYVDVVKSSDVFTSNDANDHNDVATISEKTEPSTDWDDEESFGGNIQSKAQKIENKLSGRSSPPAGGVDVTGAERTQMILEELDSDDDDDISTEN